ncbi:hypothetical protein [Streptomyces blastmyceticus]|uniref:Uncharacterized protein n=1 Tax=Streptomyces blastmyceticus TaxID=68180 RepID=A0ABN0XXU5_9ACTN
MTATHAWGTGYRFGVLVADRESGALGVTKSLDGRTYTIKGVPGGKEWTADMSRLRLATTEERATLGLSPRSMD